MKLSKLWVLLPLCTFVAGCVPLHKGTVYQKQGFLAIVGYHDRKISNSVYQVTYTACPKCGTEIANQFAMRRAQEIAKQNNCQSFKVLSKVQKTDVRDTTLGTGPVPIYQSYPYTQIKIKLVGC